MISKRQPFRVEVSPDTVTVTECCFYRWNSMNSKDSCLLFSLSPIQESRWVSNDLGKTSFLRKSSQRPPKFQFNSLNKDERE